MLSGTSYMGKYLDDVRIRENLVQFLQFLSERESIDHPIALARTQLHQTHKPIVRPIAVVFEVDSYLLGTTKVIQHARKVLGGSDPFERSSIESSGRNRLNRIEHVRRI